MSQTTNVPMPVFGPNGFVAPAESAILAGVQADINAAFGGDLNFTTTDGAQTNPTSQGQLATSETAIVADSNVLFLQFINGVDPAFSSGRMQDGIGRIYFITRKPALPTVVTCTVSGKTGVVIPAGALAQDTAGNQYICTESATIPLGGSISTTFENTVTGPIACAAGTLNTIIQTIPGWDSITNPADGVIGQNVESAAAFEQRRAASVAANANGTLPAILGSVLSVDNVIDAYVLDNATGAPVTTGGVTLIANSLYVCVTGGLAADVALAIWKKKAPGCAYNGSTSVTVSDPSLIYTSPPSYIVKFQESAAAATWFLVDIVNSSLVPSNAQALIAAAIMSAFIGADGGARARIGSTIYASRYYAGVAGLGAWAQIISLQIGLTAASFTGSISGTALTVTGVVTGTIAIGQALFDTTGALLPGTTIIGGSGTSWTVSTSQTVSAETMSGVVLSNSVTYDIDQGPTTSASNIAVGL